MTSLRRVPYSPRSVNLDITTRCNLRCVYCSHFESAGDVDHDLSTDEWLKFFGELNEAAVLEVILCGGEPLIRDDFRELVEGIVHNRMRFSILSNGTLINDELAAFIAKTGRCNSFQVSIDGPSENIHAKTRGSGSFSAALEGLKCLKHHGIPSTTRLTLTRYNYKYLEDTARLLLDDIGLPGFSTNSASPFGMCQKNADKVALRPEEYAEAMAIHLKLQKKYGERISAQAGPLSSLKHWREMEHKLKINAPPVPTCGHLSSCGGVFTTMAVRADGVFVPCSQLSHIEIGRMNHDSLKDVWQNHPEMKRLRTRQQMPLGDFEFCRGCEYIPYCRGGCPATAYNLTGEENLPVPSPDSCYRRFLSAGGTLPRTEL
jgi:SynChlorMet cassette radical SAM/SPASM protein ScmE